MARVILNTPIDPETDRIIRGLAVGSKSKGQVVDELVAAMGAQPEPRAVSAVRVPTVQGLSLDDPIVEDFKVRLNRIEILVEEIVEAVRARKNGPPKPAALGAAGDGFQPCTHCGEDGLINPKRVPSAACENCKESGHTDFGCGLCLRAKQAAGFARESTASDTSGIDFDPQWRQ